MTLLYNVNIYPYYYGAILYDITILMTLFVALPIATLV